MYIIAHHNSKQHVFDMDGFIFNMKDNPYNSRYRFLFTWL